MKRLSYVLLAAWQGFWRNPVMSLASTLTVSLMLRLPGHTLRFGCELQRRRKLEHPFDRLGDARNPVRGDDDTDDMPLAVDESAAARTGGVGVIHDEQRIGTRPIHASYQAPSEGSSVQTATTFPPAQSNSKTLTPSGVTSRVPPDSASTRKSRRQCCAGRQYASHDRERYRSVHAR